MERDYYVFNNGRLKRKDNTLYFIDAEGNKKAIPIEQVNCMHLFGEIDVNSKLLNYLAQYGIMLKFYNYYGYYSGMYVTRKKNVSGFCLVNQSKCYLDEENRLFLAKCFIESAIFHILRNLRRHKEKEDIKDIIDNIKENRIKVNDCKTVTELMGVEGVIRKKYYKAFNSITGSKFPFQRREKRPPTTEMNALISFGNSLMYTAVLSEIYKTQVDPTISFLHEPSTKRFSLSLDIAEIFKPLVIDTLIFYLINNNIIQDDCFTYENEICFLNEKGRKIFISEFEKKMSTTIKHRVLKRKVSYRMFIRLECYKLIKHFIGEQPYKPLKAWW